MNEALPAPEPSSVQAPARPRATVPEVEIREGRYLVRFARDAGEIAAALRLRYTVFNLELGEGLAESHLSGRDEDRFDASCHHLLVFDTNTRSVVGTYRMQTAAMARAGQGFYSDDEYDLSGVPPAILHESVEVGRACVAKEHRKQKVLFALWKGLAAYLVHTRRRYLFGCCSLTSQVPREGRIVREKLLRDGCFRPDFRLAPRPGFECVDPDPTPPAAIDVTLPTLFGTYLRFGALVCSEPALDRTFGTIDFLVLMDTDRLPERTRATFFGP